MEYQYKVNDKEMENGHREKELGFAKKRRDELVLRVVAVVLSLVAAVVLATDKQTTLVPVTLVPTFPAMNVPATARWQDLSASVYFFVANVLACIYGAISLLLTLANKTTQRGIARMIITSDLVMVVLLFSSIGASSAIGIMVYEGNSHLQWKKVCNVVGKFCHQGTAALVISGMASFVFFLLVLLPIMNVYKRY